jgi:hypothetical protein
MQKIKLFIESNKGKDILTVIIVILVGISSFYLGRLSNETDTGGVKIEYTSQEASAMGSIGSNNGGISLNPSISERINNNSQGSYFASKRGKKYYPAGCSAGKSIKQENRIYFQSSSEAEKAGYTLASSC